MKGNTKYIEYFCKYCKAKGVSMHLKKTSCPNCGREIEIKGGLNK